MGSPAALKVQSWKVYNNKYMMALTQITITEMFTIIAVLVFKLLSITFCLQAEKIIETVEKTTF